MAELTLSVRVAAPPEQVWAAAVDWDRQHEWMVGTTVRGGRGHGARLVAFTGWHGIGFHDPMTITTWDPPHRCVVRHEGNVVRGTAAFEVLPDGHGGSVFVWSEWLVLPFGLLGELGYALLRPLVLRPLRRSLDQFAAWVSTRGTPASPSPGTTAPR
jgi:carbon monoxide dehydrogenase subunit G